MKALRLGSAVSAIALAGILAGCAAPMSRSATAAKGKANLAYGIRAQMALSSGDYVSAVSLAEQAVEASPQDASVRGLLGNAYFAAGRFASAEAAYGDTPLARTEPAAGDPEARSRADRPGQERRSERASPVCPGTARSCRLRSRAGACRPSGRSGAGARRRGSRAGRRRPRSSEPCAGECSCRVTGPLRGSIAAQDISPDLVDARVQQWMALAKPAHSYDQVAALVGVSPAAADPGQPVRLALNADSTRVAVAAPAPQPAPVEVAAAPSFAAPVVQDVPAPVAAIAEAAPAPVAPAPEVQAQHAAIASAAAISPEAPAAFAMMTSNYAPKRRRPRRHRLRLARPRHRALRAAPRRSSSSAPTARKSAFRPPGPSFPSAIRASATIRR